MRRSVPASLALLVAASAGFVALRAADDPPSTEARFCSASRTAFAGAPNDEAVTDALASLSDGAPTELRPDVDAVVASRRTIARARRPGLTVEEALAMVDLVAAGQGAPLERVNRQLADCGIDIHR